MVNVESRLREGQRCDKLQLLHVVDAKSMFSKKTGLFNQRMYIKNQEKSSNANTGNWNERSFILNPIKQSPATTAKSLLRWDSHPCRTCGETCETSSNDTHTHTLWSFPHCKGMLQINTELPSYPPLGNLTWIPTMAIFKAGVTFSKAPFSGIHVRFLGCIILHAN